MKTAISLADSLFQEVEHLAEQENLSRSEVFAQAVKEYLDRHRHRQILESLNQAYGQPDTKEERTLKKKAKRYSASKISKWSVW